MSSNEVRIMQYMETLMRDGSDSRYTRDAGDSPHLSMSKAAIAETVRAVYAQAAADHLLADHLKEAIGGSRGPHVDHACRFWSAALVSDVWDSANSGPPDLAIAGFSPCCFQRWLALFRVVIRARWPSALAEPLVRRVEEVSHSIRSGTFIGPTTRAPNPVAVGAR
jgi:truncated hemoglobin YjbI